MKELRCTLLTDGSSDQALMPILNWILHNELPDCEIQSEWADLRNLRHVHPKKLEERIPVALELFPCDLLFIHRDAESQGYQVRKAEIIQAITQVVNRSSDTTPAICVIPVRMQEAWLLIDEGAIRKAAGNPNGKQAIDLPPVTRLEDLPDPKDVLHGLLLKACGLKGARLKKFRPHQHVHLIPESIDDFSPLRNLAAFNALENDIQKLIEKQGWNKSD